MGFTPGCSACERIALNRQQYGQACVERESAADDGQRAGGSQQSLTGRAWAEESGADGGGASTR
jgi:hypothetical protein